MRAVFDTNVLVAASRSKNGVSYRLLSLQFSERFELFEIEVVSPAEFLRSVT